MTVEQSGQPDSDLSPTTYEYPDPENFSYGTRYPWMDVGPNEGTSVSTHRSR